MTLDVTSRTSRTRRETLGSCGTLDRSRDSRIVRYDSIAVREGSESLNAGN